MLGIQQRIAARVDELLVLLSSEEREEWSNVAPLFRQLRWSHVQISRSYSSRSTVRPGLRPRELASVLQTFSLPCGRTGGEVNVASELGKGARFELRLPLLARNEPSS